jgi:hypothetical protein
MPADQDTKPPRSRVAFLSATRRQLRTVALRNASSLSSIVFVSTIAASASLSESVAPTVYLLSFWHYYLYWLAFTFASVPLDVFKRDAIAMKTVSIGALAAPYLAAPPDLVSLAVIAGGILLNVSAAAALGADRTYYGREVAGLPARKVTAFPYSLTAHPMILGNVVAFGGTLINDAFRQQWWPLAGAHVALNIGLLVMELGGAPKGRHAAPQPVASTGAGTALRTIGMCGSLAIIGGLIGAAAGGPGATLGASAFGYGYVLYRCYSSPPGERPATTAGEIA